MSSVIDHLLSRGAPFLVLPAPDAADAEETARTHGIPVEELSKTEVVITEQGPALMVIPAQRALDVELVRTATGESGARPATHAEIRAFASSCEDVAAVPPLAGFLLAPMYVDPAIADLPQIAFPAGSVHVVVVMEREHLFLGDPYVVAPLTRESYVPQPSIASSRRPVLAGEELVPHHLTE